MSENMSAIDKAINAANARKAMKAAASANGESPASSGKVAGEADFTKATEVTPKAEKVKAERGITAMDIAKRLLDYGFHAPTVYFPLIVPEAMMMEPTETESKETLDAFVAALEAILGEEPAPLHDAPYSTPISRPNDVQAARSPHLTWKP